MFCEMNAEELTAMQCLFSLFQIEAFFLWTILRRCYLLAVSLSCMSVIFSLIFPSKMYSCVLLAFLFWEIHPVALALNPSRKRFLKQKCGVDAWPHRVSTSAALFCPSLLSPAARGASRTWRCIYHFTSSFFFFLFFNGLRNVKYNAVKSFLLLNNKKLCFISLHL